MKAQKFTLVELLVVVATLAVLAGLLIPAPGKAHLQARRIACANNHRTLIVATSMYADCYDFFPVLNTVVGSKIGPYGFNGWKVHLMPFLGLDLGADVMNGSQANLKAVLGDGVFRCPSWVNGKNYMIPESGPAFFGGTGYNWGGGNFGGAPLGLGYVGVYAKPATVSKPVETLATGDTSDGISSSAQAAVLYQKGTNGGGVGDRHEGGINVSWVDGHVSYMKKTELETGKPSAVLSEANQYKYYYLRIK